MLTEIIQYGYYDNVGICTKNPKLSMCGRITLLNNLAVATAYNSMSATQYKYTKIMETELIRFATDGETTQYVINGICAGLVSVCLIVIIPIFTWVIQDKSYVLSIFSDIENEELHQIIHDCKKIDIKTVKFKKKWFKKYDSKPTQFWNKVIKRTPKKSSKNLAPSKDKIPIEKESTQNLIMIDDQSKQPEKRKLLSEIEYFFIFKTLKAIL